MSDIVANNVDAKLFPRTFGYIVDCAKHYQWAVGVAEMTGIFKLITLMGLLFTAVEANGQILTNSGFETGDASGWVLSFSDQSPERWQIVTSPVHEGNYALLAKNWPKDLSTTFSPIAASLVTEFSFWISVTLDSTSHVEVYYEDGTSTDIFLSNIAGGYVKKDVTNQLDLAKNIQGFRVYTWSPGDPGAVDTYYDSFTLSIIPEGGTMAILGIGCGIILLFGSRRRQKITS